MVVQRLAPGEEVDGAAARGAQVGGRKRERKRARATDETLQTPDGDATPDAGGLEPALEGQPSAKKKSKKANKKKAKAEGAADAAASTSASILGLGAGAAKIHNREKRKLREAAPPREDGLVPWFTHIYEAGNLGLSKLELYSSGSLGFTPADFAAEQALSVRDCKRVIGATTKAPPTLFICAGALRACKVMKPFQDLKRPIAKLFAKHLKLEEQVEGLTKRRLRFGFGTPHRLLQLAEQGALNAFLTNPKAVVVLDLAPDVKKMTLLDMPMVSNDCFQFLRKYWVSRPREARPRLAFLAEDAVSA